MKQTALKEDIDTLSRIASIEQDVAMLKSSILRKATPSGTRLVKLKGIIKGVDITETDINAARSSLYSSVKI
ncbi:MAG: hypothetical protein M0Z79_05525 [Nitrospiraceae bacterium]|nr:hypothetical protein [Nitrospiraceae bacterium]